jgi:hypothetical protein
MEAAHKRFHPRNKYIRPRPTPPQERNCRRIRPGRAAYPGMRVMAARSLRQLNVKMLVVAIRVMVPCVSQIHVRRSGRAAPETQPSIAVGRHARQNVVRWGVSVPRISS